jgi:hypothetical protein
MELFLGGQELIEKADMKEYQKPEIVLIDDPAFDEMGQGSSGFYGGNNGYHYGDNNGNNGNHYGGGHGGGKSNK